MKKIAITMGDPAGIGPEIIVKSLVSGRLSACIPVVIGCRSVFEEILSQLNLPVKIVPVSDPAEAVFESYKIFLIESSESMSFVKRTPTEAAGHASVKAINLAACFALDNKVDALVTAPITKESLKLAGYSWPGHTEMLAELTNTRDYAMMLAGGPLRVVLVTIHTAIRNVPDMITEQNVLKTIRLAHRISNLLGIASPRIGVAGLNPHAGEASMFGEEEQNHIIPAVRQAQAEGIPAEGPFPPDTLFHRAFKGEFDVLVCMYHDQGLIPLKMIAFETGVNVTVGLPFVRTSPDHGTAYEIAWTGNANPSSMIEAINLAVRLRV